MIMPASDANSYEPFSSISRYFLFQITSILWFLFATGHALVTSVTGWGQAAFLKTLCKKRLWGELKAHCIFLFYIVAGDLGSWLYSVPQINIFKHSAFFSSRLLLKLEAV